MRFCVHDPPHEVRTLECHRSTCEQRLGTARRTSSAEERHHIVALGLLVALAGPPLEDELAAH
eukprot:4395764-Alexandrium_andersonii.AAC.1